MQDFRGKTAFVTGGASGLGLSMARAFGRAGMNVVLADIDDKAAKAAAEQLAAEQIKAVPVFVAGGLGRGEAILALLDMGAAGAQLGTRFAAASESIADVSERTGLREAALEALAAFGKVHVVCNNAGVAVGGPIGTVRERDWDWIIDVNLKSVVYGTEVFVPLIKSHGEGGHFVNTASMAGMISPPGLEPY